MRTAEELQRAIDADLARITPIESEMNANGHALFDGGAWDDEVPAVDQIPESGRAAEESRGSNAAAGREAPSAAPPVPRIKPPLTIQEWGDRDLPPPDNLMGELFSTTSRALMAADTGLGKTNFAMQLSMHMAAAVDFLHWHAYRPARVLYLDGEMSRRLYRERIGCAAARLPGRPPTWFGLNREDVPGFAPLNSPEGQAYIEWLIGELGGVDFIFFDSIMCLLGGNMKEPDLWAQTLPWALDLTRRKIGQFWITHTGHDKASSYGDKTKEWQMDAVMHLTAVQHPETDVSFNLEFRKARERSPANRADFAEVHVTLIDDQWASSAGATAQKPIKDTDAKFLTALQNAIAGDEVKLIAGRRAVSTAVWKAECERLGLVDLQAKAASARSLFSRHRAALVAANRAACQDDWTWLL